MSPLGFCPGSKKLKEPTPEEIKCPQCGYAVEIWSHEIMRHCPQCHTPIMREKKPSCLDWCAYAKECIGPQLYARLYPEQGLSQDSPPIQLLKRQHNEAIKHLGILKGATLCLRAGTRSAESGAEQTLGQATDNIASVLHFFDGELRDHFRREKDDLFPLLDKHLAEDGSPIAQMLAEHREIEQKIAKLKELAQRLPYGGRGISPRSADDVDGVASEVARLLRGHIEKENTILFPLVTAKLSAPELAEVARIWSLGMASAAPGN